VIRRTLAQTKVELRLTLRRGESVLLTFAIPILLLGFFSAVDVLPKPDGVKDAVDFLLPGILALAVMSTAMVSLAIATGFERDTGVLKRLGVTPLRRSELLAAKTLTILIIEVVQVAVLFGEGVAIGWRPHGALPWLAVGAMLLATVAFAGLGLLLAGTLPALTTLAAANGLWLVLLLVSGMVFPIDRLPGGMQAVAKALPSGALAQGLDHALGYGPGSGKPLLVLAAWAVISPVVAAICFRWE
jgi:ABC-2 type transport system permease protein